MKKRISIHLQPPVFYLALIPLISFLIITGWRLACNSTAYAGNEDFMIRQLAQITGGCVWLAFGGHIRLCHVRFIPFHFILSSFFYHLWNCSGRSFWSAFVSAFRKTTVCAFPVWRSDRGGAFFLVFVLPVMPAALVTEKISRGLAHETAYDHSRLFLNFLIRMRVFEKK